MQKGTTTEEQANTAPYRRRSAVVRVTFRKAKPEPRRTMPKAAMASGANSTVVTAAKAGGKPVHRTTRQKINHTWLASQTGAMACSMT